MVVTFDDGFYDFAHNAVPVLSEFGYPCTVYVTTHYSNYRVPITNLILDYLLWKSEKTVIRLPEFGFTGEMPLRTFADRQAVLGRIKALLERNELGTVARDEAACILALRLGVNYGEILKVRMLQILCPEKVSRVAQAGVDVQLHTHRHRLPIDETLVRREIEDNRRRIVELTGRVAVHFCYPSGCYSPEYVPWLRACGVESATTCDRGFARRNSDVMRLPRVLDDSRISDVRFEAIVNGLLV